MNRRIYCEDCGRTTLEVEGTPGTWCTNTDQHDTKRYVRMRPIPKEGRKENVAPTR